MGEFNESGIHWLDVSHRLLMQRALLKVWPGDGLYVDEPLADSDRYWATWLEEANGADVWSFIEPGDDLNNVLAMQIDHARLRRPDLTMFLDSLTTCIWWDSALRAAAEYSEWVLVADFLMDPTPEWWKPKNRLPIPRSLLIETMDRFDCYLAAETTVDYWHRWLFLKVPPTLFPVAGLLTTVMDTIAQGIVDPEKARHSALLFRRRN